MSGGAGVLKKGLIQTIIGIVFVIGLAGCLRGREPISAPTPTPTPTAVPVSPTSAPTNTPGGKEEIPVPKNDIIIYSLDSDNFEKIAISVKVETGSITLFELAKKIANSLEDESFSVKINDAYFEKTTAIVDFSSDGAPGISAPNYEISLLDCIGQSIIENYDNCTAVVFRIDGKAYVTENFSFGIDEAYLIK